MWSSQVRKFGPLNRFGLWFDASWTSLEERAARVGEQYRLVNLMKKYPILSNERVLRFLGNMLDEKGGVLAAERMKIQDNSLLLFYSKQAGYYLPKIRGWEAIVPVVVMFFTKTWIPTAMYLSLLYITQPLVVSASNLLVVRMDLLPHSESILFHKVGIFGRPRLELVPIKNLEKISPVLSRHGTFEDRLHSMHEPYMFRDVETGIEYAFDVNGSWHDENLKHPLIN